LALLRLEGTKKGNGNETGARNGTALNRSVNLDATREIKKTLAKRNDSLEE